jgi:hypothetical protein
MSLNLSVTILPLVSLLPSQWTNRLLKDRSLKGLLLWTAQTLLEGSLATVAASHLNQSIIRCQTEERWQALFIAKAGSAISAIQNRHSCCGFNSILDRAYPFPASSNRGALECSLSQGRDTSCGMAWEEDHKRLLGLLLGVAVVSFGIRTIFFAVSNRQAIRMPWSRSQGPIRLPDESRLLEDARRSEEEDIDAQVINHDLEERFGYRSSLEGR